MEVGKLLKKRYVDCEEEIFDTEVYHSLFKSAMANGYDYIGQPVIISEYGGIAFNNDDSGWGYGNKVNTEEDFVRRFDKITTAVKEIPYVCGYCRNTDYDRELQILQSGDRRRLYSPDKTFSSPRIPGRSVKRN